MKQFVTKAIVLSRTNYGEADRIVALLTPDHGKLRLMARGVRKPASKLAGGIELFSVSDVTFMPGRGEIGTLISSRLRRHYGTIVQTLDRVQLGYDLIKQLNKATEDEPEAEYFDLLEQALAALDDAAVGVELIGPWFEAHLLHLAGHSPNLTTDNAGAKLQPGTAYNFDFEAMAFIPHANGRFTAGHIKALRLLFSRHRPPELQKVQGMGTLLPELSPLLHAMLTAHA